jgi:hypothetical protein
MCGTCSYCSQNSRVRQKVGAHRECAVPRDALKYVFLVRQCINILAIASARMVQKELGGSIPLFSSPFSTPSDPSLPLPLPINGGPGVSPDFFWKIDMRLDAFCCILMRNLCLSLEL